MENLKVDTKTETTVTVNGYTVEDVMLAAQQLAHSVLEELSIYRQRNEISEDFFCEGDACAFLDMIGD